MTQRLLFSLSCALLLLWQSTSYGGVIVGTVDYVYDGDTLSVRNKDGKRERIRLDHVDAPESGQRYSRKAQAALGTRVRGKEVRIDWSRRDEFGRPVGVLFLGKENINHWLVREGHVWKYRYSREPEYKTLMETAQRAKRGLWSDSAPMDPWVCRKLKAQAVGAQKDNVCR